MNREADINRVNRAIEHIKAAVTNIKSIKAENITRQEKNSLNITVADMDYLMKRLTHLADGKKPKVEQMPFDCLP